METQILGYPAFDLKRAQDFLSMREGDNLDLSLLFTTDDPNGLARYILFFLSQNPRHPMFVEGLSMLSLFKVFPIPIDLPPFINKKQIPDFNYQLKFPEVTYTDKKLSDQLQEQFITGLRGYFKATKNPDSRILNAIERFKSQMPEGYRLKGEISSLLKTTHAKLFKKGRVSYDGEHFKARYSGNKINSYLLYSANDEVHGLKLLLQRLIFSHKRGWGVYRSKAHYNESEVASQSKDFVLLALTRTKRLPAKKRFQSVANLFSVYLSIESRSTQLDKLFAQSLLGTFPLDPSLKNLSFLIFFLSTQVDSKILEQYLSEEKFDKKGFRSAVQVASKKLEEPSRRRTFVTRLEYWLVYHIEAPSTSAPLDDIVSRLNGVSVLLAGSVGTVIQQIAERLEEQHQSSQEPFLYSFFGFDALRLAKQSGGSPQIGLLTRVMLLRVQTLVALPPDQLSLSDWEDIFLLLFKDTLNKSPKYRSPLVFLQFHDSFYKNTYSSKYLPERHIDVFSAKTNEVFKTPISNYVSFLVIEYLTDTVFPLLKQPAKRKVVQKQVLKMLDGLTFHMGAFAEESDKMNVYKRLIFFYESLGLELSFDGKNLRQMKLAFEKYIKENGG